MMHSLHNFSMQLLKPRIYGYAPLTHDAAFILAALCKDKETFIHISPLACAKMHYHASEHN